MFSSRTPEDLTPNRLARALAAARAEGRTILDLTESNPTRAGFDYPSDLLRRLADSRGLTYAPSPFGLLEARAAVARDYSRRGVDVIPQRIALTASTSEAYGCLFKLLTDAGDEVLIPRPSYPLFEHLASLDRVTPRSYGLDPDAGWRIDFDSLEDVVTSRTRAILVVSPNNPTGSFVKSDEVERLSEFAAAHDLALVADEVFADYELTPGARATAGRLVDRSDVLSFSLGGLSKSVGLPQLKLAWIAVGGAARLVEPALERLEIICDTYLSVSTPVQVAASELLERGASVRDQIARRVSANYRRLLEKVARCARDGRDARNAPDAGEALTPGCRVLPSEGGWSAVLEVPPLESEEDLVVDLVEDDGVLAHPGYFFDFPRECYLVVSLLVPESQFADGTDRVLKRFDCAVARHD
jgi:aspartate/methionine/tyrosine aminotransferase